MKGVYFLIEYTKGVLFLSEIHVAVQARNQDFMWGDAIEAKVDQTTDMYFLLSHPFI